MGQKTPRRQHDGSGLDGPGSQVAADLLAGRDVFYFTGDVRKASATGAAESLRGLGAVEVRTYCLRKGTTGPETFPPTALVVVDIRFAGRSGRAQLAYNIWWCGRARGAWRGRWRGSYRRPPHRQPRSVVVDAAYGSPRRTSPGSRRINSALLRSSPSISCWRSPSVGTPALSGWQPQMVRQ